jgi:hypothetical protein
MTKARITACAVALMGLLGALAALVWLALTAGDDYAATRLRNALIAQVADPTAFDWPPSAMPPDFRRSTAVVPEVIGAAVAAVSSGQGAFDTALILADHLYSPSGYGAGIQADSVTAYRAIVAGGRGYCSDFTQVMNALGYAAGITMREWGMSFDDYSGNGHAFSEVWADELGQWVFIDSFYSFYVVDAVTARPLSVLEFQRRLMRPRGEEEVDVVPVTSAGQRFDDARAALDYYRRGGQQVFLYLGNDALGYDAHSIVRALRPLPSSMEQLAAIVAGVHPRILLLRTPGNAEQIASLQVLRAQFVVFFTLGAVGTALCLVAGLRCLLSRRRRHRGAAVATVAVFCSVVSIGAPDAGQAATGPGAAAAAGGGNAQPPVTWAEGVGDKDGATRDYYHRAAQLAWLRKNGDWRDARGELYGDEPWATASVRRGATGYVEFDLTDLARAWLGGAEPNHGVFLRCQGIVEFATRESGQPPELVIVGESGRVVVPATADTELNASTFRSRGTQPRAQCSKRGNRTLVRFDLTGQPAAIRRATMRIVTTAQFADRTQVQVFTVAPAAHADTITVGAGEAAAAVSTAVGASSAAVRSGLAARYPADRGLEDDPDVLLVERFASENWQQRGWRDDGGYRGGEVAHSIVPGVDSDFGFAALDGPALQATVRRGENQALNVSWFFRDHLEREPEDLYMRYYVRLGSDWSPQVAGGKLPGLAGTYYGTAHAGGWGGRTSNGRNGWSARGLFDTIVPGPSALAGRTPVGTYLYHAGQRGTYGDIEIWNQGRDADRRPTGYLPRQRWVCYEVHVRLNTPGRSDGIVEGWLDGVRAYRRKGLRFRARDAEYLRIERAWLNLYHGGSARAEFDQHAFFDNVVVATRYIGPMTSPEEAPADAGQAASVAATVSIPAVATVPAPAAPSPDSANRALGEATSTALGRAAAALAPGELAVFQRHGDSSGFSAALLYDQAQRQYITQFASKGLWDPVHHYVEFLGAGHHSIGRYLRYVEQENRWQVVAQYPASGGDRFSHGYEHHALDPATGDIYRRVWRRAEFGRFDKITGEWRALPPAPVSYTKHASAIEFFPELDGFVFVDSKAGLWLFQIQTSTWKQLETPARLGLDDDNHLFAVYNPIHRSMLIGGGDRNRRTWLLDARSVVREQARLPAEFGPRGGAVTADPVTGEFLAFGFRGAFLSWTPGDPAWVDRAQDLARHPAQYLPPGGGYFPAIVIPRYGVIMFIVANGDQSSVLLYRHAAQEAVDSRAAVRSEQ